MPTRPTDKASYLADYAELFSGLTDQPVKLLEIGVYRGGSLELWKETFPLGSKIYGIDNRGFRADLGKDITLFHGEQDDLEFLRAVVNRTGQLDIIIDDAAHIGAKAKKSFWFLFDYLKLGGKYVIEDWGTGFWDHWPDGNKRGNMVDFVKELIEEVGSEDATRFSNTRKSFFKEVAFRHAICCVTKGRRRD